MSRPFLGTARSNRSFRLSTSRDMALSAPKRDLVACSETADWADDPMGVCGTDEDESRGAGGTMMRDYKQGWGFSKVRREGLARAGASERVESARMIRPS